MVPSISAVSVLVIDCTTIGAPPPTATLPTITCVVLCRVLGPAMSSWGGFTGWFMGSRISGFDDIHQGAKGRPGAHHPRSKYCLEGSIAYPGPRGRMQGFRGPRVSTAILDRNPGIKGRIRP